MHFFPGKILAARFFPGKKCNPVKHESPSSQMLGVCTRGGGNSPVVQTVFSGENMDEIWYTGVFSTEW